MNTFKTPLWRRACRALGRRLFHWAENNDIADGRRNGEEWLVRSVVRRHVARASGRPLVVIDAGANAGDYTAMVFGLAKSEACEVEIHAFEPSATARGRLKSRFGDEKYLRIIGRAVGEDAGVALLHGGADGSTLASLVDRPKESGNSSPAVEVEVCTLRAYLTEAGIERVDLLKLDVEGFELAAMRGLSDALRPECVGIIQFEYGGTTLDAGVRLREIYDLLVGRGYQVAKLLPSGLAVREYAPWMEHFHYANYVAIGPEELL